MSLENVRRSSQKLNSFFWLSDNHECLQFCAYFQVLPRETEDGRSVRPFPVFFGNQMQAFPNRQLTS